MTITEALRAGLIIRVIQGERWLYWADGPQYGPEQDHWVVRESSQGRSRTIMVTEDEAEAVAALVGKAPDPPPAAVHPEPGRRASIEARWSK